MLFDRSPENTQVVFRDELSRRADTVIFFTASLRARSNTGGHHACAGL